MHESTETQARRSQTRRTLTENAAHSRTLQKMVPLSSNVFLSCRAREHRLMAASAAITLPSPSRRQNGHAPIQNRAIGMLCKPVEIDM
eukprot:8758600-Alexandrium_andersonii.AAC.1